MKMHESDMPAKYMCWWKSVVRGMRGGQVMKIAMIIVLGLLGTMLSEAVGAGAGSDTTRQKQNVSSSAPLFEQVLAVSAPKGVHGHRGMPGDIIQLKDGTLVMSYTKDGSIMAVKSKDTGRSWGASYVLVANPAPPEKGRYSHPSFLRLPNGHILLSYIYSMHPATPYYGHNYYRRSADEGASWSEQFVLTPHPGYVLVHNDRLFLLSSGRIVAPAEYKARWPSSNDHNGYVGTAFYSDDNGYSWQVSKNVVDMLPIEVQEAHAVELKDKRVMMFARTYSGHPVCAYSSDGCESWSEGQVMSQLKMPYAGLPTVKRIPATGDLLFIWISEKSTPTINGQKVSFRCALTSAISRDEGKTFSHFRNLAYDPEDDFGYQSLDFIRPDLALVSFHARDGLHVARIAVDWFYGQ
jgi:sialidase-1